MSGRSRARDRGRGKSDGALWTPAQRGADLHADYSADSAYVTLVSGAVAAWADQSGNGRDLAQGSAPNRLGYSASEAAFNGRAAILGTGAGWIDRSSMPLAPPFTAYGVWASGTPGAWSTLFDDNWGLRAVVRANPSGNLASFAGAINLESTVSVASASIVCAVFNGASSALYVGSLTAAVTGNPGANGLVGLRVGAAPGSVYFLPTTGAIARLTLFVGADDAAERAQMMRYLRSLYNLPVTGL